MKPKANFKKSVIYSLKIPDSFLEKWFRLKDVKTVDWFQENIRIPKKSQAISKHWNKDFFPFQVGVLDCFDDIEVREISLRWATQLGKTTLLQGLPAKIADCDPSPILFACADENQAKEMSSERIIPTAKTIHTIKRTLVTDGRQDSYRITIGDCIVYMGWSGSPATLGGRTCRYLLATEVSKWTRTKSVEADSLDLARERLKAFYDSKAIFEGTPTILGVCRITELAQAANQLLLYHVPCPHCDRYQYLTMDQIKFEKLKGKLDRDTAERTAYYQCRYCKEKIRDTDKLEILRKGVWAEESEVVLEKKGSIQWTPGKSKKRTHLDLSTIYSPVVTFGEMAAEFVRCILKRSLQNFFNSWLGQVYTPYTKEYNWEQIKKRLTIHQNRLIVPDYVQFITAGMDIQKDTSFYTIRGWGHGGQSRLIDWGEPQTFQEAEAKLLIRKFHTENKKKSFQLLLGGVDTGYNPFRVYNWVIEMNLKYGEHLRCIKGGSSKVPFFSTKVERSGIDGKIIPGGVMLWHLWDEHWKDFLVDRFSIELGEPGAWEVPKDADERYLRGITAEAKQEKTDKRGNKVYEWVVTDTVVGNHYFDCEKITAAMADMCGWRELLPGNQGFANEPQPQEQTQSLYNEEFGQDYDLFGDRDTTL